MANEGGVPEVVARWRGHCDHDILAWKAVQTRDCLNILPLQT
ncbi:MAG: hypothetical protein ACOYJE_04035 [Bacteroidaceae bacterium]